MPVTVRTRGDVDGCGCLACRGVSVDVLRRSVPDAALWTVELLRGRPALLGLGVALAIAPAAVAALGWIPAPLVETLDLLALFAVGVVLRGAVATVAAGALSDQDVSTSAALGRALRRTPALVAVVLGIGGLLLLATSAASTPVMLAFALTEGKIAAWIGADVAMVAVLGIYAVAVFAVLFKCWLAFEACVVGGYGPLASLRVSWRVTGHSRNWLAVLLIGTLGSVVLTSGGAVLSDVGPSFQGGSPPLQVVGSVAGSVTSLVWFGLFGHLYVRGILVSERAR